MLGITLWVGLIAGGWSYKDLDLHKIYYFMMGQWAYMYLAIVLLRKRVAQISQNAGAHSVCKQISVNLEAENQ